MRMPVAQPGGSWEVTSLLPEEGNQGGARFCFWEPIAGHMEASQSCTRERSSCTLGTGCLERWAMSCACNFPEALGTVHSITCFNFGLALKCQEVQINDLWRFLPTELFYSVGKSVRSVAYTIRALLTPSWKTPKLTHPKQVRTKIINPNNSAGKQLGSWQHQQGNTQRTVLSLS